MPERLNSFHRPRARLQGSPESPQPLIVEAVGRRRHLLPHRQRGHLSNAPDNLGGGAGDERLRRDRLEDEGALEERSEEIQERVVW